MQTKAKTIVKLIHLARSPSENNHINDCNSKMRQWKAGITTCGLEYARRNTSRYRWKESSPFGSQVSTTNVTINLFNHLPNFQKPLQLGEQPVLNGGNTFSQRLRARASPFLSIANSFCRQADPNWYKWPPLLAKSLPSSMATTEWAALHRHQDPTFSHGVECGSGMLRFDGFNDLASSASPTINTDTTTIKHSHETGQAVYPSPLNRA